MAAQVRAVVYPNGGLVLSCDGSIRTTGEGAVYEADSIRYVYERLSDRARIQGHATLVDVGAQVGLYALYAKHFDGIRVDAYEPLPRSYARLLANVALNGVGDRVFPFQLAVSNTKANATMRFPEGAPGLCTLGADPKWPWEELQVETDTLDSLYADRRVDFVKCDAEGWEYFVLHGGRAVLARDKPELLLEWYEPNMRQCGVAEAQVAECLRALGYRRVATMDLENVAFSWCAAAAPAASLLTIVCCTPDKPERRAHMEALCREEGLEPEFSTDLGLFVRGDDPACAALRGTFKPHPAFRAHYLTYLRALRHFLATGAEHALIMEDDLVRCGAPSVQHVIAHAPEFDILFLEYCFAECGKFRWVRKSGGAVYVGGFEACCTGACVYSREGARRLLDFAAQTEPCVIDHVTVQYSRTERGQSHVAYARPPLFVQDREAFPGGASDPAYHVYATDPSELDAAIACAEAAEAEAAEAVVVVSNWAGFFSTFLKYIAWTLCAPRARVVCLYVENGDIGNKIERATEEHMRKENLWDVMFDQGAYSIAGRACEPYYPTEGYPPPLSGINGGYIYMNAHVYASEHFPAIREIYHRETQKLSLTPFIASYIRDRSSALVSPSTTIAVFVRYPGNFSDSDANSSGCTRTIRTVIDEVACVMAERSLEHIFLVTMVDVYVAAFQEAFQGRVKLFAEKRMTSIEKEWDADLADYRKEALDAFSEVYAASTCAFAIGLPSNMLLGCLFLNPSMGFKIFDCGRDAHPK